MREVRVNRNGGTLAAGRAKISALLFAMHHHHGKHTAKLTDSPASLRYIIHRRQEEYCLIPASESISFSLGGTMNKRESEQRSTERPTTAKRTIVPRLFSLCKEEEHKSRSRSAAAPIKTHELPSPSQRARATEFAVTIVSRASSSCARDKRKQTRERNGEYRQ